MNRYKELDDLCRRIVIDREGGRCYVCGLMGSDLAHIFGRTKLATRFDTHTEGNCHILCRQCHSESHNDSPIYEEMYVRKNGEEALDALRLRSNTMVANVKRFLLNKKMELLKERDEG